MVNQPHQPKEPLVAVPAERIAGAHSNHPHLHGPTYNRRHRQPPREQAQGGWLSKTTVNFTTKNNFTNFVKCSRQVERLKPDKIQSLGPNI